MGGVGIVTPFIGPGVRGLVNAGLARNIRADKRLRHIPIIMITSRTAEKHRQHAAEIGVNHYLGKPYDEEELLARILECLDKPH